MFWKTALAVLCFSPSWATTDSDVTKDPADLMQAMLKMGTAMASAKADKLGSATDPRFDILMNGMKTISAMSAAKRASEPENTDKVWQHTMSLLSEAKKAEGTTDAEKMVESKTITKHTSRKARKAAEAAAEEAAQVKLIEDAKQAEEERKAQEQEAAKKKREQFLSMVKAGGEMLQKRMTDSNKDAAPEGSSNPGMEMMKAFLGNAAAPEGSSNPIADMMKGLGGASTSAESTARKENILKLFRDQRSSDNTQNMPGADMMKALMGGSTDDPSKHDPLSNSGLNMMKSIVSGNTGMPKQDEAGMRNWLMNN
jgi:hypothetical protein